MIAKARKVIRKGTKSSIKEKKKKKKQNISIKRIRRVCGHFIV